MKHPRESPESKGPLYAVVTDKCYIRAHSRAHLGPCYNAMFGASWNRGSKGALRGAWGALPLVLLGHAAAGRAPIPPCDRRHAFEECGLTSAAGS